jgi:polar amino acid transport system substrate-binding protein
VRSDSPAASLASLGADQRVGVPVGSLVSMTLAKAGNATSPFVFEDDIVAALANREIEAAAVTAMTVGWFNLQHADTPLRLIPAFDNDQDLRPGCFALTTSCERVSMRQSNPCWPMAPSRGSLPAMVSS